MQRKRLPDLEDLLAQWEPISGRMDSARDYLAYEEYFRGGDAAIEGRADELNDLVRRIAPAREAEGEPTRWLDIGSGRGLVLRAVAAAGMEGYGIEVDTSLARLSREAGQRVFCGDALAVLRNLAESRVRFQVVSALHVIEHLEWAAATKLVDLMGAVVCPGGRCVLITPNIRDIRVLHGSFYRDPTHVRPYPTDLLEYMVARLGMQHEMSRTFDRFLEDAVPRGSVERMAAAGRHLRELIGKLRAVREIAADVPARKRSTLESE